jgi:plastocyanin
VNRSLSARPLYGGLILSLALIAAACSSGGATSAPSSAPTTAASTSASAAPSGGGGTAAASVSIKDFSFAPADLTARVGQEITWTNTGNVSHTVTFDSGGADSGSLSAGATFSHTFDAPGTFTYHCSIHSSMQATITVTQ